MYFGVGRSGKGYCSLSLSSLSLSLSLSQHTHTHTHTVGERKNVKFLTVVVRKCIEIFFFFCENKDGGSVNAN